MAELSTGDNELNSKPHGSEKTELNRIPDEKGRMIFPPGVSGNPAGRPKGSVSVITEIKRMFEESPEMFADFINKYLKDPKNRQHIVEMIDGRPKGSAPMFNNQIVMPILAGKSVEVLEEGDGISGNNGNTEATEVTQEN